MELKYCIRHEREVYVYELDETHMVYDEGVDYPNDITWCEGPFAFCHPPELEEDWELNLDVPSPDEPVEMDAVASELLTEFALV